MDATLVQTMFNGGCGFALVQSSWILKNNSAVSMVRTIDFAECFLKNPENCRPHPFQRWSPQQMTLLHCSGAGTSGLLSPAQEILVELSFNAQQWHEGPMSASRILIIWHIKHDQTISNYVPQVPWDYWLMVIPALSEWGLTIQPSS